MFNTAIIAVLDIDFCGDSQTGSTGLNPFVTQAINDLYAFIFYRCVFLHFFNLNYSITSADLFGK